MVEELDEVGGKKKKMMVMEMKKKKRRLAGLCYLHLMENLEIL